MFVTYGQVWEDWNAKCYVFCVVSIQSGVILMLNETAGAIKQLVYFPCSTDVTTQIYDYSQFYEIMQIQKETSTFFNLVFFMWIESPNTDVRSHCVSATEIRLLVQYENSYVKMFQGFHWLKVKSFHLWWTELGHDGKIWKLLFTMTDKNWWVKKKRPPPLPPSPQPPK